MGSLVTNLVRRFPEERDPALNREPWTVDALVTISWLLSMILGASLVTNVILFFKFRDESKKYERCELAMRGMFGRGRE